MGGGDRCHWGAGGKASRAGGGWVRAGEVRGAKAPGANWDRDRGGAKAPGANWDRDRGGK